MTRLNVANRTLAIMDNLTFLRSLNNECIDLIAIDPPFAANETFTGRPRPPISKAEYAEETALAKRHDAAHNEGIGETRVKDVWSWDTDIHPSWKSQIEDDYPNVHAVIQAVEACAKENEAAYICFMAVRLIECRRVLKPTGSIYVHCDDHANSYLRMTMDAIFGTDNFRNEITWRRATSHNDAGRYGRIKDYLLFYVKSDNACWNGDAIHTPKTDGELAKSYPSQDGQGRYRSADLTGPKHSSQRGSPSTQPWRNYDVYGMGRVWSVPKTGKYAEYIEHNFIPDYRGIEDIQERLDALDAAGLIHHPSTGKWPGLKRYAIADQGNPPQDLILQPTGFTNYSASGEEFTGYATQKPLALYQDIIQASSNPGDVVLDIFAGCATTAVAAENTSRQWIACDMAYRSATMLKRRFYLNGYQLEGTTDATIKALASVVKDKTLQTRQQFTESQIIGPKELPKRDDVDPEPYYHLQQARQRGRDRSVQTASWSGRISKEDAKKLLINRFGAKCWGCGYEPRRPNGSLDETLLEVDHIRARKAAEGVQGDDELYNLALLHRTCNGIKGNRRTLEEVRRHNADSGLLYVNTIGELVDLYEATRFAAEQIAAHDVNYGRAEPGSAIIGRID